MCEVLVDHARRKQSGQRGDGVCKLALDVALNVAAFPPNGLIALDSVLNERKAPDANAARIVELPYFAGLTLTETAEAQDHGALLRIDAVEAGEQDPGDEDSADDPQPAVAAE